jgi:hypothetical protein
MLDQAVSDITPRRSVAKVSCTSRSGQLGAPFNLTGCCGVKLSASMDHYLVRGYVEISVQILLDGSE